MPSTSWVTGIDTLTWEATVLNSKITQEIVGAGLVKIYLLRSSSWWPLPYTESREALTQFTLEAGKIILLRSEAHGAAEKPTVHSFRLVVAPADAP